MRFTLHPTIVLFKALLEMECVYFSLQNPKTNLNFRRANHAGVSSKCCGVFHLREYVGDMGESVERDLM